MEPEPRPNCCKMTMKFMGMYWKAIFTIVFPLCCIPIFVFDAQPKFKCLYVIAVMAGYWVTECIPLPVTGLIPVVLLPVMDIQSTGTVCLNYFKDTNMIFMASILIAIAIEYSGLHNRIALFTILKVGCSPRRLHFGLMAITMLLSMWLINAATTAMMCPIIAATLAELEAQGIGMVYEKPDPEAVDELPRPTKITRSYFLGVAWASTIGGTGSLVGTGTNLSYKGIYETRFPNGNKITFVDWLLFNVPVMLASTFVTWLWMQFQLMGLCRPGSEEGKIVSEGATRREAARTVIEQRFQELGRMSWHESAVGTIFLILVVLWVLRDPQFMPGWGEYIAKVKVSDSSPAIFAIIVMIVIPASCGCLHFCSKDETKRPTKPSSALVTWQVLQEKMPWGLLFLLGGGFAIADAGNRSGMSQFLGEKLSNMKVLHPILVLFITSLFASLCTELTSNVAICNVFIPVLTEMSVAMETNPMYFTYVAAVACSHAFMMPSGTPANAIVAGKANIQSKDMAIAGIVPKLMNWLILVGMFLSYGRLFFHIETFPEWAKTGNTTEKAA